MFKGKKALVTGASRGIGFAIARDIAEAGCNVVITGRNPETLKNAAGKMNGNVIPMVWDASEIHKKQRTNSKSSRFSRRS